jgi:DNA-binding transcriptional ArsR family regulator
MKVSEDRNKALQDVSSEYQRYCKEIEEKNSKYREHLGDIHCQKIYDMLFSEVKLNNKFEFRFKELLELTGMTRPTLNFHLKHLEEKRFLTKNVETKYKTFYRLNLTKIVKVCKIKKSITGKEKLELIDIRKLRTGDEFIPMEPVKRIPIREETDDSQKPPSNKKTRQHFKAHKNKRMKAKNP